MSAPKSETDDDLFFDLDLGDETPVPAPAVPEGADNVEMPLSPEQMKEIYDSSLANPRIKQGANIGSCYFVLALAALHDNPIFPELVRRCVFKIPGGWRVKFWGSDLEIDVTEQDIQTQKREIIDDDSDDGEEKIVVGQIESPHKVDRIFEVAYDRFLRIKKGPEHAVEQTFQRMGSGGFPQHVLRDFLGDKWEKNERYKTIAPREGEGTVAYGREEEATLKSSAEKDRIFSLVKEGFEKPDEMILVSASALKGPYNHDGSLHQRVVAGKDEFKKKKRPKTFMDQNGRFVARHAYGIKVLRADESAFQRGDMQNAASLRIINPWDTSKEYTVTFQEFLEYFANLSPIHLLHESSTEIHEQLSQAQSRSFTSMGNPFFVQIGSTDLRIWRDEKGWWMKDSLKKKTVSIPTDITVGRLATDPNFKIEDPAVSRNHLQIQVNRENITFKNLGTNGTRVETSTQKRVDFVQRRIELTGEAVGKLLATGKKQINKPLKAPNEESEQYISAEAPLLVGSKSIGYSSTPDSTPENVIAHYFQIDWRDGRWYVINKTDTPDLKGLELEIPKEDYGKEIIFGRRGTSESPYHDICSSEGNTISKKHFSITFGPSECKIKRLSKLYDVDVWSSQKQKEDPERGFYRPAPEPSPAPMPTPEPEAETGDFADFLNAHQEFLKRRIFSKNEEVDSFISDISKAIGSYFLTSRCTEETAKELARVLFERIRTKGLLGYKSPGSAINTRSYILTTLMYQLSKEEAQRGYGVHPEEVLLRCVLRNLDTNLPALSKM